MYAYIWLNFTCWAKIPRQTRFHAFFDPWMVFKACP
jgi:hypothetical protein